MLGTSKVEEAGPFADIHDEDESSSRRWLVHECYHTLCLLFTV